MKKISELIKLETKINKAYYKCKNTEYFFESKRGYSYARQWEQLMIELRGWSDYKYDDNDNNLTKKSWIDYCEKTNIFKDYSIGDVCA